MSEADLKKRFGEHEIALREKTGPTAILVAPKLYQPSPDSRALWVGELDVASDEPTLLLADLSLVIVRGAGQPMRRAPGDLYTLLGSHVTRHDEPTPHVVVQLRGADRAQLAAALGGLGDAPGVASRVNPADATDRDIKASEPGILVKIAASAQALTGVFVALSGLQLTGLVWRVDYAKYVPYLLMVMGMLTLYFASQQYRARKWAGLASGVFGPITALVMLAWTFYVMPGILSLILVFATGVAGINAILSPIAIGSLNQTAAARKRLAAQGMDLGL